MGTPRAAKYISKYKLRSYAEVGILKGDTVRKVAGAMGGVGEIHLFDYQDVLAAFLEKAVLEFPKIEFTSHPNTRKLRDSYCWSLMKLVKEKPKLRFDYVYLDGAHVFETDGLAFFLIDKLLRVGGFIELDDHTWTARVSIDNHKVQLRSDFAHLLEKHVTDQFTDEQLKTPSLSCVIDLLVRPMPNYNEVLENRIFRKTDVLVSRGSRSKK